MSGGRAVRTFPPWLTTTRRPRWSCTHPAANGWRTAEDLQAAAARSTRVGNEDMPDDVRWIRSYVLDEGDGAVGTSASTRRRARRRSASTRRSPSSRRRDHRRRRHRHRAPRSGACDRLTLGRPCARARFCTSRRRAPSRRRCDVAMLWMWQASESRLPADGFDPVEALAAERARIRRLDVRDRADSR